MPIRDILFQMSSYPLATPAEAIDGADRLAAHLGARLSAALFQVRIPRMSNFLADKLVDANGMIAEENHRSLTNAEGALATFIERVAPGRLGSTTLIECTSFVTASELIPLARVHDLTVLPTSPNPETRSIAEGLIFGAGRPVLLLPSAVPSQTTFDSIVIGWDGSRSAARALADCLSFCERAKSVRVVAVTGEKALESDRILAGVQDYLRLHRIEAEEVEVPAEGVDAGTALLRYCNRVGANLLVMGAYGHSRVREFILGGATRAVLSEAAIPVLLSH